MIEDNGDPAVSVTIDISANTGDALVASGNVSIQSADLSYLDITSGTIEGSYGAFTVNSNGYWVYEADRSLSALVNLEAGESLVEELAIPTEEGDLYTLLLYIAGPYETAELLTSPQKDL